MTNIDAEINKLSYDMFESINKSSDKKELKNFCDKAMGVLSQDWPYAYNVFVMSKVKDRKKNIEKLIKEVFVDKIEEKLFKENNLFWSFKGADLEQSIKNLSWDLHQYLYFRQLLEKVLIYLRYHLKTLDTNESTNE